jgi:hypothetical protein
MPTESSCTAPLGSAAAAHGARFYRFQDSSGRTHLVDSLDSVPQALRAHATCIEYGADPAEAPSALLPRSLSGVQIFGLGFALALLVVFVFSRLPGTLRLVLRLAIVGALIAVLAGAYFGWLRRGVGQSNDTFAGPGALIDDAKGAVAKMNARIRAEQAELKEIEQAK